MSFQWVWAEKKKKKGKRGKGRGKEKRERKGKREGEKGEEKRKKEEGKGKGKRKGGREKENILWSDPGDTNLYNIFARFLMMVLCVIYSGLILKILRAGESHQEVTVHFSDDLGLGKG